MRIQMAGEPWEGKTCFVGEEITSGHPLDALGPRGLVVLFSWLNHVLGLSLSIDDAMIMTNQRA